MESMLLALTLIIPFEGLHLKPYLDVVGVPTIGYGTTRGITMDHTEITVQQAEEYMRRDTARLLRGIRSKVTVPLTINQEAALISFVYNVGIGNFTNSTLLKKINAGDYQGAVNEFGRWIYAGGKKFNGLIKRRDAERKLFSS